MFGQHHASISINSEIFWVNVGRIDAVISQKLSCNFENPGFIYFYFIEISSFQRIFGSADFSREHWAGLGRFGTVYN